jgi:hypothetical protein
MSFRTNLRRARSHLITAAVLLLAGAVIVRIEDRDLGRKSVEPPYSQRDIAHPLPAQPDDAAPVR